MTPDVAGLPLFNQPLPGPRATSSPRRITPLKATDDSPVVGIDWTLCRVAPRSSLRALSQAVAADRARLDRTAQEELGRSIVLDLIESTVSDRVNAGDPAWPIAQQKALARAVFDSLFRLGRTAATRRQRNVENIINAGHDNVMLELIDGSLVDGPPVAESDEELIDFPRVPCLPFGKSTLRASPRPSPGCTSALRRLPPRRRGVGDAAAVGSHPPPPADAGHP